MRSLYLSLAAVTLFSVLMTGCSEESDSNDQENKKQENTMHLSGQFVTSNSVQETAAYSSPSVPTEAASRYDTIVNAIAVPVSSDRIMMDASVDLDIMADGNFSAAITPDYAWIVILEGGDGSIRFMSLPLSTDSNTSLVTFYPSADIDLGKVTYDRAADEANSDHNITDLADKFIFNLEQLKRLARTDDVYKAVANSYRNNYKKGAKESHVEEMQIVSIATDAIQADIAVRADTCTGFAIDIYYGADTLLSQKSESICSNSAAFGLKFPESQSTLYTSQDTYTGSMRSSNMIDHNEGGDPSCETGSSFAMTLFRDSAAQGGKVSFFRGETRNMLAQNKTLEKGLYALYIEEDEVNTTVAKFELDYDLPTTDDGKLLLPVPEIRLHLEDNSNVDYFDVKWYLYDTASASYEEIDFTLFSALYHELSVGIWVGDGIDEEHQLTFNETFDRVDIKSKVGINWGSVNDVRFGIQYGVGNSNLRFSFSKIPFTP